MRYLLFVLTFLLFQNIIAQGALDGYMKGKDNMDIALSFSSNRAEKFIGADKESFDAPFKGSTLSLFATYGITDRFDAVVTLPAVFTSSQSGLQDGGAYVKYRPIYKQFKNKGRLGVIGGMGMSFPLSDYEPLATGSIGQKATVAQPRLIVQYEMPQGLFINLTGGYNFRMDNLNESDIATIQVTRPSYTPTEPVDYSTFLLKIGYPAAKYYLDAWVERQITKGGSDYAFNVIDLPQSYGVSYTQVGGTIYGSNNGKVGYLVSFGYILNGRNTSRLLRLTGGVVFKL